jgi:hypothetical protein
LESIGVSTDAAQIDLISHFSSKTVSDLPQHATYDGDATSAPVAVSDCTSKGIDKNGERLAGTVKSIHERI